MCSDLDQEINASNQAWRVDQRIENADENNMKLAFRKYFRKFTSLEAYNAEGRPIGPETCKQDVLDKGNHRVYLKAKPNSETLSYIRRCYQPPDDNAHEFMEV
jgi:hypothetical protein